jgi:hypothetical protein
MRHRPNLRLLLQLILVAGVGSGCVKATVCTTYETVLTPDDPSSFAVVEELLDSVTGLASRSLDDIDTYNAEGSVEPPDAITQPPRPVTFATPA